MKANRIKKVLIAMDYDPTSKKIAEAGFKMAKAMAAEISLLHVGIDLAMYSLIYPTMGAWQIDEWNVLDESNVMTEYDIANKDSHNFLQKAKRHLGDTAIQTMLKEGDPAQNILETAKGLKADCIVMGSHSKRWLENIVMGSTTEEVLRKTTIPMYLVPIK